MKITITITNNEETDVLLHSEARDIDDAIALLGTFERHYKEEDEL